ncbi:MAG: amidase [Candidatus Rokubacteria bacterium]|nr:amidase [Candidatus Rokubacteria bacterium]
MVASPASIAPREHWRPSVSDRDLCFTPATELVRLYRARKVSPLEVMEAVLARIDRVNPRLNAYVTLARESALAAARGATRALGRKAVLPPLHGVPVSIKDLTPTRGIRTTWGSKIFADHVPDEDAVIVQRLRAAGAIVVGKTNTPEFGAGGNTFNAVFGATRNPWNPALTCGGSSGGAAVALATGMGPIAQGSDLGGSLRMPAAFCGVVGFRTTPGLVPVYPKELAWDSLSVTGPMARTIADTALMLSVVAGPDDRAPLSYAVDTRELLRAVKAPSIKGWRVAWTPDLNGLIPVDDEVAHVAEGATRVFRSLGARVEAACCDFSEVEEIVLGTRGLSMVALHADRLPKWRDQMQRGLVWNVEQGLALTPQAIARGEKLRTVLWHRVRTFMESRDLLILPTTAVPPFPVERPYPTEINGKPLQHYIQWAYLTYGVTVTGLPVISVPCGFTRAGLPVGLQIVGRRRQEAAVLRAAAAFEAAAPWAGRIPPAVEGGA